MVEIYYNSGQFTHTLPVLIRQFASPFHMYGALADYYRSNGYMTSTPSRIYRYQVLLDFACSAASDKRALFVELLIFDLYLRENLKSRPDFAQENIMEKDPAEKQKLRRFFEHEEQMHDHLNGYEGCTSVQLLRMTHVERFTFPVWKTCAAERTTRLESPVHVLFDYRNRNALTHDAAYFTITL